MARLNQVFFIGNAGRDPEQFASKNGDTYTKFSIAVDQGKEEEPLWLSVTCWKELGDNMLKLLHKGSLVFVQGRLQVRKYQDKNDVERTAVDITATNVQVLEKAQATEEKSETPEPALTE